MRLRAQQQRSGTAVAHFDQKVDDQFLKKSRSILQDALQQFGTQRRLDRAEGFVYLLLRCRLHSFRQRGGGSRRAMSLFAL